VARHAPAGSRRSSFRRPLSAGQARYLPSNVLRPGRGQQHIDHCEVEGRQPPIEASQVRFVISIDRDGGAIAERVEVDGTVAKSLVRDVGVPALGVLDLPVHADPRYETSVRHDCPTRAGPRAAVARGRRKLGDSGKARCYSPRCDGTSGWSGVPDRVPCVRLSLWLLTRVRIPRDEPRSTSPDGGSAGSDPRLRPRRSGRLAP
jgi:hypothetical protein